MSEKQRILVAFRGKKKKMFVLLEGLADAGTPANPSGLLFSVSKIAGETVKEVYSITVIESDEHLVLLEDFYNFKNLGTLIS